MKNKKFEFDTDGFQYYHNTYVKSPINNEKSRAQSAENTLNEKVSVLETAVGSGGGVDSRISAAVATETTRAQAAEQLLQEQYNALTQSDIIVGALPASGTKNKIYRVPGTNTYSDYMWNGSSFVKMATYDNAINNRVLVNDNNIVSSQGILNELYWDVIHAGYLDNSGKIVHPSVGIEGTNRCILIPVMEDDIIDIVVDENSSYVMVAFVSSWPSNESPGNSATIVGGRKEFNHNGRIKAPNGAIYLWASLYAESDSFNRGAKKIFKNNKLAFCWFNRCDYSQNQLVDSFINNDYAQFIEGYMGTDGKWVSGNDDISIVVPVCEGDVITFDVDRNASNGYCMTAFFKQTLFNEFPSTDTIIISDRTEYNGTATVTVTIPSDVYYMWFSCYKVSTNFLRGPQYIKKNGIVVYDKISIPNENKVFMPSLTTLYTCRQGQVGGCPENSLVGFRTAYQYGYRRVRVSIEFTSDNVPVGFHDATLATTGIVYDSNGNVVTNNSLTINGMTYAELLNYDFGLYAGSKYKGTKIMKIEDFLIQCKKYGQYAVLEIKDYPDMTQEQARILFNLVRATGMERHVKYSTYTNTSLGYILALDPHATIGFIGHYSSSVKATLLGLLSAADEVFYDMYDNDIDNVPSEDYNELRAAGLKFKSGTGTNETQARNLYRFDDVECMTMKCLDLVEL